MGYKKNLSIYYCGMEECKPGHSFGPAIRPHYLMHFVLRGKGIYQVKGKEFKVNKGEAFLIRPQDVTYYEADLEDPWEYVWIAFDGEEADAILEEYQLLEDKFICQIDESKDSAFYLRKIAEAFLNRYDERELMGYFYLIISSIKKEKSEQKRDYDKSYLDKAISYIRYNYSYNINVSDIARHVGIERTYLYKIFMRYQKMSPKQYLTRYRLLAAKDMLGNTKYTITEIALSCGFHNSSMFSKSFQKEEKISPSQFRKQLLEADQ